MVEDKIRMCDVLSDIEVAQDLLEPKEEEEEEQKELQPHPADEKYATLQADLKIIRPEEEEYQIVQKFAEVRAHSCMPNTIWLQPGNEWPIQDSPAGQCFACSRTVATGTQLLCQDCIPVTASAAMPDHVSAVLSGIGTLQSIAGCVLCMQPIASALHLDVIPDWSHG